MDSLSQKELFQTYIILQCRKVAELYVCRLVLQELLEVHGKFVHLEYKHLILLSSSTKGNKRQ